MFTLKIATYLKLNVEKKPLRTSSGKYLILYRASLKISAMYSVHGKGAITFLTTTIYVFLSNTKHLDFQRMVKFQV